MKYVITGHLGLIGRTLKKSLGRLGYKCVGKFDKRMGRGYSTSTLKSKKMKADILFHLADNCKINKCIKIPELSFENIQGIQSALEMCRKNSIKKIVHSSSSRVLSSEKNPYTAGKIYGEELVKSYHKCYDIDYIIIRPSTVYGGKDETGRLMNIWMNNAKNNKDIKIYGNANKTLSFTYITDFIDAVIRSLKKWNREYNISGEEELLIDIAKNIIKQTKSKSKIKIESSELEQPQKVNLESEFKCRIKTKEGIRRCLISQEY